MIDLLTIDPATAMPSAEFDALIATEWMGWTFAPSGYLWENTGKWTGYCNEPRGREIGHSGIIWSPTTNAAHAGEARRRADDLSLISTRTGSIICLLGVDDTGYRGRAAPSEVTGTDDEIKERIEALATCRAILAAIQARK